MNRETGKQGKKNDETIRERIYDSNEYISVAKRVQNGTVPMNILQLQYPFNFICIYSLYIYICAYDSLHSMRKSFIFIRLSKIF